MTLRLCLLISLVALAAAAAKPQRIAVIVGANRGAVGRDSLRYSYRDAREIADVLVQVGEFEPQDVHVLDDPQPAEVLAMLDQHLSALAATPGESLLLFYYSGHADGVALYPDGKPLSFAQLRERLESPRASVRLGIVDACSGGGWTGTKGLHPGAPFAVDVPLQLTGEGSVLISSSSGLEAAHESERLLGSFFTHHLVAALRGAADPRGDGVVTVTDAFAYAKERTVRDTAAIAEPQHPSFSMNLRGRSDLPLARTSTGATLVELRENEGPLQLIHLGTGLVVLEVPSGQRTLKLALPPGRYLVRREAAGGNLSREIAVYAGRTTVVSEEDLQLSGFPSTLAKNMEEGEPMSWPLALNDRPLTLRRGLLEADLALLAGASAPYAYQDGLPLAFTPSLYFGVTDALTLSLTAPGRICFLRTSDCDSVTYGVANTSHVAAGATLALPRLGPVELAAGLSIGYGTTGFLEGFPVRSLLTARLGAGGPLAFLLTGELDYLIPSESGATTEFSGGVTPQLVFQALPRLALDLIVHYHAWIHTIEFNSYQQAQLGFGATWAVNPSLDLRARLTLFSAIWDGPGGSKNLDFNNARQLTLGVSYRR
jgi:hypothetical protein